jgi:hypothetical protein
MKGDMTSSITGSRAYKQVRAEVMNDVRSGRFTPATALVGHREIAAVVARPSKAKGKARRRSRKGLKK